MIFKVFIVGWGILITAIILNIVALRLGITTWYPFLDEVNKMGFYKSFLKLSIISKAFLFVIYPLGLGVVAYFIFKLK
jgi:hypothetical protein